MAPTNSLVKPRSFSSDVLFLLQKRDRLTPTFQNGLFLDYAQVIKVLFASASAYSANPSEQLRDPPALTGSSIGLVSIVQVI